jgi:hypothetical protein
MNSPRCNLGKGPGRAPTLKGLNVNSSKDKVSAGILLFGSYIKPVCSSLFSVADYRMGWIENKKITTRITGRVDSLHPCREAFVRDMYPEHGSMSLSYSSPEAERQCYYKEKARL